MARASSAAAAENAAKNEAMPEEQVESTETLEEQEPPVEQEPKDDGELVTMIVGPRCTVHDGVNKHGPGVPIKLTHAEAKRLKDKGFVIESPKQEQAES